jgi:hypothetical protein
MPSKLSWLALGLGAYIAFVLAQFPANAAYRWFAPPELELADVNGTVWSGRAAVGDVADIAVRDVSWNLAVGSLLIGRVSVAFDARLADGFVNGNLVATTSQLRLTDVTVSTSLQTLNDLLPIYAIEGQVSLALERLVIEDAWPLAAVGELRIGNLEAPPFPPTPGAGMIPLGSFRAQLLELDEPGVSALLTDSGGPLELEGRAQLATDRSYLLDGLVRARPEASDMLLQGLAIMTSEPDADGRRSFTLAGTL